MVAMMGGFFARQKWAEKWEVNQGLLPTFCSNSPMIHMF
jgi:hypothetical protein